MEDSKVNHLVLLFLRLSPRLLCKITSSAGV